MSRKDDDDFVWFKFQMQQRKELHDKRRRRAKTRTQAQKVAHARYLRWKADKKSQEPRRLSTEVRMQVQERLRKARAAREGGLHPNFPQNEGK